MPRDDVNHGHFPHNCNRPGCPCGNPHPPLSCGNPYVGPTGPRGATGPTGPQGERGATGAQGQPGATGAQGQPGATGAQGLQGLRGPQGATGAQGERGANGARGETGPAGPQGFAGPAGQRGERGLAGPQGVPGPAGSRGASGPRGDAGPAGLQGTCVRMLGSYDSMDAFIAAHPTGEAGDSYLVAGRLQTWDETNNTWMDLGRLVGPTGASGPSGERGPVAATIPFSIAGNGNGQGVQVASDSEGRPQLINFAGFGSANHYLPIQLEPGEWDSGIIHIGVNISYPSSFILPYDCILQNIYLVFANREAMYLEAGIILRPFVCIATCDCTSLDFTILPNTMTFTEPYIGGEVEEIPKYSLRTGSLSNLNITLTKGTLIGIIVGWMGEGEQPERSALISVSGGLFME